METELLELTPRMVRINIRYTDGGDYIWTMNRYVSLELVDDWKQEIQFAEDTQQPTSVQWAHVFDVYGLIGQQLAHQ